MSAIISVVIPCYNAAPWIGECLASVLAQDGVSTEIIVIDDGSTDASAEIVEKQAPQARLVRTPNQGPSKARNLGMSLAQGDFFQFLDADDLLAPGKLARQFRLLRDSGADVAYGNWQKLRCDRKGNAMPAEIVAQRIEDPEIELFTDFWCPPAVYLFSRMISEKAGGFPDHLPVIQDARFVLSCALQGAKFVYSDSLMAYYRLQGSGSVSTKDKAAFMRDCFRNALDIKSWWESHGGLTPKRQGALNSVYAYILENSVICDRALYSEVLGQISLLNNRDTRSSRNGIFRFFSAWLPYITAEWICHYLHRFLRRDFRHA